MAKKDRASMGDTEIVELYVRDKRLAGERVVEKYGNYVYHFLNRNYPTYRSAFPCMYHEGVIGMLKALRNYDAGKGAFTSYSTPFIHAECSRYIRYLQGESSEHFSCLNQAVRKAQEEIESEGETADAEKVAAKVGIRKKTAEREMKVSYVKESLDTAPERAGEDEFSGIVDRLACEALLKELPEKKRKIVYLKAVEGMSFARIAALYGEKEYEIRKQYYEAIAVMRSFLK